MATNFNFAANQAEQQQLDRRKKLLEGLAQGLLEQPTGQMVSGHYVGGGIPSALAKLASAYFVSQGLDKTDKEQQQLTANYNQELQQALANYQTQHQTNPALANITAMTSGFAPLAEVGKARLAQEKPLNVADLLPYASNAGRAAMVTQGITGFTPSVELKSLPAGQIAVNDQGQVVNPTTADGKSGFNLQPFNGGLIQTTGTGAHSVVAPPAQQHTNITTINQGESAFEKTLGEGTANDVKNLRAARETAQQQINLLNRMEALEKQGMYSGMTANLKTYASNLANVLNLPGNRAKLATSEAFQKLGKKDVATALLGPTGAKMTDKDLELLLASNPSLTDDAATRKFVYDFFKQDAMNTINRATAVEDRVAKQFPRLANVGYVAPANNLPPPTVPEAAGRIKILSVKEK